MNAVLSKDCGALREEWVRCSREMPECDRTVLGFWPASEDEPVWPCFWDGECWRDTDNLKVDVAPVAWRDFPHPEEDPVVAQLEHFERMLERAKHDAKDASARLAIGGVLVKVTVMLGKHRQRWSDGDAVLAQALGKGKAR